MELIYPPSYIPQNKYSTYVSYKNSHITLIFHSNPMKLSIQIMSFFKDKTTHPFRPRSI